MQTNHKPSHYFPNNDFYFITASTYHKQPIFNSNQKKELLKNVVKEKLARFDVKVYAFVLMDNHYHLLVKIENSKNIPDFVRAINGKSAFLLNKLDNITERIIWYNYWDTCIKEEKDFWSRFNYIHHNPVKHGYIDKMTDYSYSSYGKWLKEKGEEWMNDVFVSYPIIDYTKGDN